MTDLHKMFKLDAVDVQEEFEQMNDRLTEFLNQLPPETHRLDMAMKLCASVVFSQIIQEFERDKIPINPVMLGSSAASAADSFRDHMVSGLFKVFGR